MARDTEPLLARRPSSHNSQAAAEEDALLTGQPQSRSYNFPLNFSEVQWRRLRETVAFIWAFLATIGIIILAVLLQHATHDRLPAPSDPSTSPSKPAPVPTSTVTAVPRPSDSAKVRPHGKRNLIFMVSDGMGPSSLSLTRSFSQLISKASFNHTLLLDSLLLGQSRTRSSSSLVTDSAAGATAFSCGEKSYNGAISVLPDGTPCPSVMEAAKRAGYMTGVVVTTRVTDATPACFGSHVLRREMEDDIAGQMVGLDHLGNSTGSPIDIILGGGRCHFLGSSTHGSCRVDNRDIVDEASRKGWAYIDNREEFDALSSRGKEVLPLLGLWAGGDVPFEIDRRFENDTYPSLAESAATALRLLSEATADNDQGFFIMIEGSRIDHAGHINDPAAQVHEVLAYDATMRVVLDFINNQTTPTLMVATSDHETGGLAIARQLDLTYPHYQWYPSALHNATHSAERTAAEYHSHLGSFLPLSPVPPSSSTDQTTHPLTLLARKKNTRKLEKFLTTLVTSHLGFPPLQSELNALILRPVFAVWIMADMISRRAQIGWSTHGHTAADVNIYSSAAVLSESRDSKRGKDGKGGKDGHDGWMKAVRERLAGNRENTDVGGFLRCWLDVEKETEEVGRELREDRPKREPVKGEERVRGGEEYETRRMTDGFRHDDSMRSLEREYEEWKKGVSWD
ncbi:alkaline-phosphatase-like protein [Elsinoe ampelina]|uniref:Alkaline phosphatase n=1 Tax=Elsinoe ampelina TaxID=302913 RepID=A0A6A6G5W9_9PEZI|nr:alkaline-phosphatase-like protein [Elsinoe ampelina]